MLKIKRLLRGVTPPVFYKASKYLQERRNASQAFSPVILNAQKFEPKSLACFIGQPVISVPITKVRYPGGIPYNYNYHHFVQYYTDGIDALIAFYRDHQPDNIFEKHFLTAPDYYDSKKIEAMKGWFLGVPWLFNQDYEIHKGEKGLGVEHGNQRYGPVSPEKIELEANRLDNVLKSINEVGFKPHLFDGYPRGYFMLDAGGGWVFVIREGLHRVAALAHLGYSSIPVQFKPYYPRIIKETDCPEWPMVKKGYLSNDDALAIFRQYLSDNLNMTTIAAKKEAIEVEQY